MNQAPEPHPSFGTIRPDDQWNRELVAQVHPPDWVNPVVEGRYDLVVLGAGTAGLVSSMIAALLGAKVALIERHLMGGDCLNVGCVPSKGVIRAARANHDARRPLDVEANGSATSATNLSTVIGFTEAMERMRRIRAEIAPHDSANRFSGAGVEVFLGQAAFVSPRAVTVGGQTLEFRRAIVATGGRAAAPPIPGLDRVTYLTNETIFELTERPGRLIVLGGGPIGCELAQSFRRFGSEVTLINRGARLLPRDDPDAAAILERQFSSEGIDLRLKSQVARVEPLDEPTDPSRPTPVRLQIDGPEGVEEVLEADALLIAVGRAPNVEELELGRAGVETDPKSRRIRVDSQLKTSNGRIYAAGDVCSAYQFTHAADFQARVAVQNALNPLPLFRASADNLVIPWTTYTDPEVAHVGMTAEQASRAGASKIETLKQPFDHVDRALLDGERDGFARVHIDARSGRIRGATIVARHAGEMIGEMALAVTRGITIGQLGQVIHPYPTQAEALRMLGDIHAQSQITPLVKKSLGAVFRALRSF